MSLAGTLDELPFPDLLDMISLAEKTGRLTLTATSAEGMIVFRRGRIIYASSNSAREAFGNILVCMRLIDEATLRKALVKQHHSREERRLGRILVEMGALKLDDIEGVVQHQVERVLGELFAWTEGFFKFEAMEISDHGEVEVDGREFLAERGLNTHKLALDFARRQDEKKETGPRAAIRAATAPSDAPERRARCDASPATSSTPVSLRQLIAHQKEPSLTAEVTMELLRHARKVMTRGVLMLVEQHRVRGVGQFGIPDGDATGDERVRGLWVGLEEPSLLADVVHTARTYRGPLPHQPVHEAFVARLGGGWPGEVAILPIAVRGTTIAVLYGDNEPLGKPIPKLAPLAELLVDLGSAMEGSRPPGRGKSTQLRPQA
jgi:hypothetical protein